MKKTTSSSVAKRAGKSSRPAAAAQAVRKIQKSKSPASTTTKKAAPTVAAAARKPLTQSVRPSGSRGSTRSASSMAMLSSAQMQLLEGRLQELQKELSLAIATKTVQFNGVDTAESLIKGDDAEVAEKQRTNNAALQELDILKHRLELVRRALAKMQAGVYGICEETEEPIGFERLVIVPWARYSIHVQEIRERKLREFRRSKLHAEY